MDSKEPKEKHVIYLIECLRGTIADIPPQQAIGKIFERFLLNLGSWSATTKIYIILHKCLQDPMLAQKMANQLRSKEHLLHSYQKKSHDTSYEGQMYAELSKLYSVYIKYICEFKQKSQLLNVRMSEVSQKAKQITISDILMNYEYFDGIITQIFQMFEHQNFCKRTRLWSNVIFMLFNDLLQIYKVFYVMITEVLDRFPQLSQDQAKKALIMYQNFVSLNTILKTKADFIMIEFKFQVKLPQFYVPDSSLVENLRLCINEKAHNNNLEKVSQQLRGGMDRNQFVTSASVLGGAWLQNQAENNNSKFKEQEDSDSGEDFDYGDENAENENDNIDLMDYISNIDFSHMHGATEKTKIYQVATQSADLFNFDEAETSAEAIKSPEVTQKAPNVSQDLFDIFDDTTKPVKEQHKQEIDIDINKPLIPSQEKSAVNGPVNSLDMFKNLYTNAQTQPVQSVYPTQTANQQTSQQYQPFMTGSNQFQPNPMMMNSFITNQNMQGNPFNGQMMGNFNMQGGINPMMLMMMQQQQMQPQQQQLFQQNQFMTSNNSKQGNPQIQTQPTGGSEFQFW